MYMTRFRKLKRSPITVKKGSVYGGFAGLCVLLMLSCAFAGFAANAKGMDLATDDSNNWRVKDVFILPSGIQGWYIRKPVQTDAGLEVPFNQAATGEYTAYIHNTWAGDLTGMRIEAEFMIGSDAAPVFEARLPDTGSAEVQIAILTEEIKQLTVHMKEHKHDYSSRLGLIKKVQERKRLMDYLKRENQESFVDLARELKLKIALQREKEKAEQKELKDKDNE